MINGLRPITTDPKGRNKDMDTISFLPVNTPETISHVAALAEEIWTEHYASILSAEQIHYMVDRFQSAESITKQLADQHYRYYLIITKNKTAGYMGIQPQEGRLFLSKLYLRKSARGRGYARRLLAFLIGFCSGADLSSIWLTVNRRNTDSIAVYERLGFVKTREEAADIGGGYVMDDYIMEKYV